MSKNLLVTGGCGFIGANFLHYVFRETDFTGRVINVDKLTYAGNPESVEDVAQEFGTRYVFVHDDIADRERMQALFQQYDIDTVVHFAAESHVDRSITGPAAFIEANVIGTFSLLEAARGRGNLLSRFHHVSTDEVYGSLGDTGLFTETTPYDPQSPYSASKAGSDHLVRAYANTYGLPVTISNCSNNYGPYQFPEKLIPLMLLNALEGKPLPVYGDGMNVRDWLYVRDHCTAIWRILEAGTPGETYNVGGRNEMPNLEVVHGIADRVDGLAPALEDGRSRRDLVQFVTDRPGHDRRYAIDCSKIERELGWVPEESFATGMEKTVQWYLAQQSWVDRVRSGSYREWIDENYGARG